MYCVRKVTNDLYWVGANDHRLALFENCFPIPRGVSYNAYCLLDEKTVLFDTVDWSACRQLLENLAYVLDGRELDYLLVNHLEPDHAACIEEILLRHPKVKLISNEKAFMLMRQFGFHVDGHECILCICSFRFVEKESPLLLLHAYYCLRFTLTGYSLCHITSSPDGNTKRI